MEVSSNDSEVSEPASSGGGVWDDSTFVTAEEVGIVLVVLLLWLVAIVLFINRWGKIRMLEPYQPAYKMTPPGNITVQSSRINSPEDDAVIAHYLACQRSPDRRRQNSLMVPITSQLTAARKVKSAVDLVSLVIAEQREQRDILSSGLNTGLSAPGQQSKTTNV